MDTPLSLLTFPGGAVSQFNWHTIYESDNVARSNQTSDDDLPDINLDLARPVRRALGALYSYRVEYFGEAPDGDLVFVGVSPEVHTRRRLLAIPFDVTVVSGSDQLRIQWKSDSVCAEGFVVKVTDTDSGGHRVAYVNGHDNTSLAFHGLTPATNYAIKVQAFDYYGRSGVAYVEETTKPAPSEPEVQTFTVALNREQVYEGFVPYAGSFPTGGAALPKGTLQKVSLLPGWPSLFFGSPASALRTVATPTPSSPCSPTTPSQAHRWRTCSDRGPRVCRSGSWPAPRPHPRCTTTCRSRSSTRGTDQRALRAHQPTRLPSAE